MVLRRPAAKILREEPSGSTRRIVALLVGLAPGVAGRADGDVELAVGPDHHHAIGVLAAVRQVVDNPLERPEAAVVLDLRLVDVGDGHEVHRIAVDRDAVHHGSRGDCLLHVGAPVAVLVAQHDHVAHVAPRDVDRAVLRDREHARIDQIARKHSDFEAIGHVQPDETLFGRLQLLGLEHVPRDLDVRALPVLESIQTIR